MRRKPASIFSLIISKSASEAGHSASGFVNPPRNALRTARFEPFGVLLSKPKAFSLHPNHHEDWSYETIPPRRDTERGESERQAGTHAALRCAEKIKAAEPCPPQRTLSGLARPRRRRLVSSARCKRCRPRLALPGCRGILHPLATESSAPCTPPTPPPALLSGCQIKHITYFVAPGVRLRSL